MTRAASPATTIGTMHLPAMQRATTAVGDPSAGNGAVPKRRRIRRKLTAENPASAVTVAPNQPNATRSRAYDASEVFRYPLSADSG